MALFPGTRLGPYEVIAQIGEGGMGQVYRARDTKLNRDVAIKVLPESFANDADRLARFEREAQVLASLNHPNIAHIHGLEESNGVGAIVMELVQDPAVQGRYAVGDHRRRFACRARLVAPPTHDSRPPAQAPGTMSHARREATPA